MLYIVKPSNHDYIDLIFTPLEKDKNIKILTYSEKEYCGIKRLIWKLVRFLRTTILKKCSWWSTMLFENEFLNQLHKITPSDKVLLFAIKNFKTQIFIKNECPLKSIDVYIFDSIRTFRHNIFSILPYYWKPKFNNLNYHTFDKYDAQKFNFSLVKPVYFDVPKNNINRYDLCFVGYEKNRGNKLAEIISEFESMNMNLYVKVKRSKHAKFNKELEKYYISENIPYNQYLLEAQSSLCFLDILQDKQLGFTLRVLEALFMDKKLITDNLLISDEPFYHPDNIYILGKDEKIRTIQEFLAVPYREIPNELKNPYNIVYWIKQFSE